MLDKENRLQKNRDFRIIYRYGKSHAYRGFVFYYRKNRRQKGFRIGFSISKKTGKAVQRNLLKRRFKEACRKMADSFPLQYDYIFIIRKNADKMSFKQVKEEIVMALKKVP
ncbi:MAG: ribonuclease P protein component [Bacillota bacterium]|jgi:ribonuclease P protein component